MTVCVCVKVNECMVFAADSASSLDWGVDADGVPIQQVYRHGNKVFQLHRQFPVMAMTSGLGNFGQASIAMLAKQFRHEIGSNGSTPLPPTYTIKDVVDLAQDFFLVQKYTASLGDADPPPAVYFELWIGGYSSAEETPELWRIRVFNGQIEQPVQIAQPSDFGVYHGGQIDPIQRLINGFGWKLEQVLLAHGVTPQTHAGLYQDIAPTLFLPLVTPPMPIQDAIDLAEFLADMTRKVFRFRAVPELVSGDIDIATVTKFENFRWIKRKHYYPEHLNRGTDHVV
jgi:hypothetical protein